jgi:hypothetical protein
MLATYFMGEMATTAVGRGECAYDRRAGNDRLVGGEGKDSLTVRRATIP